MAEITGAELQLDRFISADPANGILASLNSDVTVSNIITRSLATGDVTLSAPANSTGTNTRRWLLDRPIVSTSTIEGTAITGTTGTFSSTVAVGGNISLTANAGLIQGTADAADSRYVIVAGGGAASDTRGAYLLLHGNEATGAEGQAAYVAGNVAAGHHVFYTGASVERMRVATGGQVLIGHTVVGTAAAGTLVTKNDVGIAGVNAAGTGVGALIKMDANDVVQVGAGSGGQYASVGARATASLPASNAIYAGVLIVDGTTARRFVFYDKDGNRAYIDGTSF